MPRFTKHSMPVLLCAALAACAPTRQTASAYLQDVQKRQADWSQRYGNGWCAVSITPIPTRAFTLRQAAAAGASPGRDARSPGSWLFQIRVSNEKAAVGPLRYCSGDLQQYQQQYAYLLTNARADFFLQAGAAVYHPSSYLYTTHYSAFPLEEILVGFDGLPSRPKAPLILCYVDRVFLHDTLRYTLPPAAVRLEQRAHVIPDFRS